MPSGASTGEHEAVELRDGDKARYLGKGVLKAVDNVNNVIAEELVGLDATRPARDRPHADRARRHAQQGQARRQRHPRRLAGGRARAPPMALGLPLYHYLGGVNAHTLPVPMMNILNGGKHADNNVDFQEFMVMPVGAESFREGPALGAEIYHSLKKVLKKQGLQHRRRRRGRLRARPRAATRRPSRSSCEAIDAGRLQARRATSRIALDPATTELLRRQEGALRAREAKAASSTLRRDGRLLRRPGRASTRSSRIEDGLAEDDWDGWKLLTDKLGDKRPARRRRPVRHQHRAPRSRASSSGVGQLRS